MMEFETLKWRGTQAPRWLLDIDPGKRKKDLTIHHEMPSDTQVGR